MSNLHRTKFPLFKPFLAAQAAQLVINSLQASQQPAGRQTYFLYVSHTSLVSQESQVSQIYCISHFGHIFHFGRVSNFEDVGHFGCIRHCRQG